MDEKKIMVVDDSAVFRRFISDLVNTGGKGMRVVTTAVNGNICLQKLLVPKYKPDVILMDILMPEMNGIEAASHVMDLFPTPLIFLSTLNQKEMEMALTEVGMAVFESGTVEFIKKPDTSDSKDLKRFKEELFAKIENLSSVNLPEALGGFDMKAFLREPLPVSREHGGTVSRKHIDKIIVIGASTGGTRAVSLILSKLPVDSPPVLIVQHMPEMLPERWAGRLQSLYTHLRIQIVKDGEQLEPNRVYVAPAKVHCIVDESKVTRLVTGEKVNYVIPSVDVTFISAARVYRQNTLGIILTGMGRDGLDGARNIKNAGGTVFAEHETTCVVYSMPKHVIEAGLADKVLPLHEIPAAIRESEWL